MIHINVSQGTPEWEELRIGIPTASAFDRILQPKKLKPSTEQAKYRNEIIACWLLGYLIDFKGSTGFMDRGQDLEAEARAWYELQHDVEVTPGGFILRDDRKVGGSPDGLVGEHGGLELKVPAIQTHVGYLINPQVLVDEYHSQVQGYLYLSDRSWWDILSYSPNLPPVEVRIVRDERYLSALAPELDAFIAHLDAVKEHLASYRRDESGAAAPLVYRPFKNHVERTQAMERAALFQEEEESLV